jgi:hypothetical protein
MKTNLKLMGIINKHLHSILAVGGVVCMDFIVIKYGRIQL